MKQLTLLGQFDDARNAPLLVVECGDDAYSTEEVKATIEKMAIDALWRQHRVKPVKLMWLDPSADVHAQVLETRREGFE